MNSPINQLSLSVRCLLHQTAIVVGAKECPDGTPWAIQGDKCAGANMEDNTGKEGCNNGYVDARSTCGYTGWTEKCVGCTNNLRGLFFFFAPLD